MKANLYKMSSRGIDLLRPADVLLNEHRTVIFPEEITRDTAEWVVSELLLMDLTAPGKPVVLVTSSPGGQTDSGLAIIDTIKCMRSPVYTVAMGLTASMAAVILAAGEKGHRYIFPHSRVMIHEPLIPGGAGGSASSIKRTSESILLTKSTINGLLADYTGRPVEEIDEATSYDNYMNARQAKEFGLCDCIIDSLDMIFKGDV